MTLKIKFWWFLLTHDQVNASSITKIISWLKLLGKNLHLVGCATVSSKSEVMLLYMLSVAQVVENENWKKLFAASLPLHSFANVFSCEVKSSVYSLSFCSSYFSILVFGLFWRRSYENMKILYNLCLHFARQDGQEGKKQKENHASKVTKIPKTKSQKYGHPIWNK